MRDGMGSGLHGHIITADDHEAVMIVRDGAGNRAALQADALNETQADVAGGVVTFDDRHLQQISRGVGDGVAVGDRRIQDQVIGDKLVSARTDHMNAITFCANAKIEIGQVGSAGLRDFVA
jgi:hypothetical protein